MALHAIPLPHATTATPGGEQTPINIVGNFADATLSQGLNTIGSEGRLTLTSTATLEPGDIARIRRQGDVATPNVNQVTVEITEVVSGTVVNFRTVSVQDGGIDLSPGGTINDLRLIEFQQASAAVPSTVTLPNAISGFIQAVYVTDASGSAILASNEQKGELFVEFGEAGHEVRLPLREGAAVPASASAAQTGSAATRTRLINSDLGEEFLIIING